ncbi:MAG: FHA domain-containing protein [Planctomycetaceae bacterium]|nr:FHA domain-containing protein [Planctomycetaceae bacterium]
MPMVLTPLNGGEQILLDKAILLFGRQPDCDVVLTGSRKISRKHCCIAQIHDYFVVRDLGSMNGVRVNGVKVDREAKLRAQDEVTIGDVEFRIEQADVPKRPPGSGKSVWVGNDDGVRRAPSHLVSRDIPVAVPEGEVDFIIEDDEETLPVSKPRPKPRSSKKSPRTKTPKPRAAGQDEVIVLGDDDIIG